VAVDDVSIRLERSEIYGLLGANGSGKSTFIRLVSGLLTLDEGRVEVFGHDLVKEQMAVKRLINRVSVGAAALFMVIGSASFIGIGMLAAILPMMSVERGSQMVFVLQSCLLLIGGVYYPTTILPEWMQLISRVSPATYILDAVRRALIDGASINDLLPDLWPLLVMAFVFIPIGLWGFGRAERYAKRTGKLKRVG
jgi:energy-coupling factor transporter ATP-binding protein EcfA2